MMKPKSMLVAAATVVIVAGAAVIAVAARGGDGSAEAATPPVTRTELARGLIKGQATMQVRPGTETVVNTLTLQPQASSGWHAHPDGGMLVVTSGTMSTYGLEGAPCEAEQVTAGQAFLVPAHAHHAHLVRNEGTAPLTFMAYYVNVPIGQPAGGPAPRPSECPASLS